MKVLHVLRKYDPREWGGTETAVAQLLEGLATHGATSVVFAPEAPAPCDPADDGLARAGHRVRHFHAFLPALGLSAAHHERLIAMGGNLMSFDLGPRLALESDVSVMHSHALGRLGGIAKLVARRRRIPFVVTIHGGYRDLPAGIEKELMAPLGRSLEYGKVFGALVGARKVVSDADAVLTCNPREAELLRREMPEERVVHMPHGVPMAAFEADNREIARAYLAERGLGDRPFLVSVARIDWVKNQGFLVDHHPALLETYPDLDLMLVGPVTDVAYHHELERRIEELGLGSRVHLLGALPPRDPRLIGLSQLSKLSVLASRAETFGLVILEAWAGRSAIVASRTSGASDVVEDGEDGWLFDIDDGPAYVAAVLAALADESHTHAMAERGREKTKAIYDQNVIAGRVLALYERLRESLERRG